MKKYKIVETIEVKTPKIISIKLWNDVQSKLQQNHKYKNYESSHNSLLKGLLYCKSCGVKISSSERKPISII